MAKGRGHKGKKDTRRPRSERKGNAGIALALPRPSGPAPSHTPETGRVGLQALRGPVSGAFRSWLSDYGRRQAEDVATQLDQSGDGIPADLFIMAPLTTRTVTTPDGAIISVQMGLPIVATRAGGAAVAPDRLAAAVLRLPEPDTGGAMAMLGLGQAPEMPPPEALFAAQLPAEAGRGVRTADALAWYLARAIEAGDVRPEERALTAAAGEALALLRPSAAPPGAARLDPSALETYAGYGAEADEEAVPPDISAAPARGGLAGLPRGAYLHDDGSPLANRLADLRDYVIGLWPFDYFGLDALTAEPAAADAAGRAATLSALADLTRRLDVVLAQSAEDEERALAAEGRPPAWIAGETAHYRETRQTLRDAKTAQDLLQRLGPILFDLEIPPADYRPPDGTEEQA